MIDSQFVRMACGALALIAILGCTACHNQSDSTGALSPRANTVALAAAPEPNRSIIAADLRESSNTTLMHGGPLSVLTFNMEHRDRPDELAVMADRLRSDLSRVPDFILLQEVMFKRPSRKGAENTASVLANMLGYHCKGTKRTSDKEGIAIASRYPFEYYDKLNMKAQTSRFLLGFRRVSVMGEFLVPSIGRVRVVNVHLTNWEFESRIRSKQLRETLEWMAAREKQVHADVTILGGDFNIEPGWNELGLIKEATHALGLRFHDYNTDQFTHGPEGNPRHRVDYIFINAPSTRIHMHGERRLFLEGLADQDDGSTFHLSDHVPVLHEYSIGAPSRTLPAVQSTAAITD